MKDVKKEGLKKDRKEIPILKIVFRIIPMVASVGPLIWILDNIIAIIHGSSHAIITILNQIFYDSVAATIATGSNINKAFYSAIILGIGLVSVEVLNGIHNFLMEQFHLKASGYLSVKLNRKTAKISPLSFENTELLDNINKAQQGMAGSIRLTFTLCTIFTFYLPYFTIMAIYLFSLSSNLIISLLMVFIPILVCQILRAKIYAKLEDRVAPIRRENDYYYNCITSRELFKETRILGGFNFFKKLYMDTLMSLSKKVWKADLRWNLIQALMQIITIIGYGGVVFLLVKNLINGTITVGAFAAVFNSIGMMYAIMDEIISRHIGSVAQNIGPIRNFIRFMDMEERAGKGLLLGEDINIKVDNVSFKYPGAEKNSIENLSVNINPGETVAIVGENGAGKSTLVKLLTGLYEPTEGNIEINGNIMKDISTKSLYLNISGVFQKYQQYKLTLKENVEISNLEQDSNNFSVEKALIDADLDIDGRSFPDGLDTILSREFDGVDLSGGQWQRLAIARGLYRSHKFIVLDEPTAAIDPIEETKIYKKFAEISKGNTAIIVTHRLGSARIADKILVMDNGKIVEQGNHEKLSVSGGKYNEMWDSQAQWYI